MSGKIKSLEDLRAIRLNAKNAEKKIVWTNGCYDILHAGHVLYLQRAKRLGHYLIVGLNSDRSIRATKGPLRPIVNQNERAIVLSALECVDYIIIFDQDSPIEIIKDLKPDIYAKGGDYTLETINQPERRVVESYGGDIVILPGLKGSSTTTIITKILRAYEDTVRR
ncbi:D-glycero-beta-D-manno-heptose 1-phosphate adenylyltransferase [candidate division KSB1 bacterium]|nr:D-glycero-beta-D-manno-heptose 1-phosphate adenylyltransferase [candidate division KSB1 bacterium]RQW05116.1 MAG: D-glycero-beta-D-manno-heptose 1-phosphate adenylyltransferase [candidate division KSB1 bacterium]